MPSYQRYQTKAEEYGRKVNRNVKSIASAAGVALGIGLLFASFMAGSLEGTGIIGVAALACFLIGSTLGFIFSIPRSVQEPEIAGPMMVGGSNIAGQRPIALRDNTNLEQISDWFVKILIGASLVQLEEIARLLRSSADKLSLCILSARNYATGAIASGVGEGYCTEFCVFLILYFLVLGFLTGYLLTRLWLPYVMLRSNLAMLLLQSEAGAEEEARKEGARQALQQFGITSPDEPPSNGGITDDPNKGKFGGKAEANGLKLQAKISKMDDIDDEYFRITLKVTTDGTRSLTTPVLFHLHYTFSPSVVPVVPENDVAVLERAAWGAFTVGVTIQGEETKLELDLAEVPEAPALFRGR